jgi:hypothetical protein
MTRCYGTANRSFALSRNDQRLITFTRDDLPSMPLHAKKEWVQQLDASKTVWNIERSQIRTGQTVLTNFFAPQSNLPREIMVP